MYKNKKCNHKYTTYQFNKDIESNEFKTYLEEHKDLFDLSDEERKFFKNWCKDHGASEIQHIEVEDDVTIIEHEIL